MLYNRQTRYHRSGVNGLLVAGIVVLVIAMIAFTVGIPFWTAKTVTFTVTDKERIVIRNGDDIDSKYLVFTDVETFENTDCLLRGKFNSSDVQGRFKAGQTYTAVVYGYRIPFMSMYRNILRVQ